jgi:hypothetical protein
VYRRTSAYDFSAGREYWKKTASFWATVRQDWDQTLQPYSEVHIAREIEGKSVVETLFALADSNGGRKAERKAHDLIRKTVVSQVPVAATGDATASH